MVYTQHKGLPKTEDWWGRVKMSNLRAWVLVEDSEHGHLSSYGLSRARWCPQKHISISVIQCVEDLSLDGVEMSELVQAFILPVSQSCHWQWLQVQQLCEGNIIWTLEDTFGGGRQTNKKN